METAQSEKAKPQLMNVNTFLTLWIGAYVLVYLIIYTADKAFWGLLVQNGPQSIARNAANLQYYPVMIIVGFLLMAATYGAILSSVQILLIRRHLDIRLKNWLLMSMVGWLAGGFFAFYTEGIESLYPAYTIGGFIVSLLAFWMPSVLIQITILNRKTKQWWMWPVANLVALLLFAVIYWSLLGGTSVLVLLRPIGFVPAAIIQGAITAGAIFQMFPQAAEA